MDFTPLFLLIVASNPCLVVVRKKFRTSTQMANSIQAEEKF